MSNPTVLIQEQDAAVIRVLAKLKEEEWVSGRELTRRAGLPTSSGKRVLNRLSEAGLVQTKVLQQNNFQFHPDRTTKLWKGVNMVLSALDEQ